MYVYWLPCSFSFTPLLVCRWESLFFCSVLLMALWQNVCFLPRKNSFFRKIIEHFDSRFLEIWLLSQTPIIIAIIISKLLWRDYWYFFGESLRCNYRRALQIFRTLKPRKKIPSSMYNFFCSSNCIYQVQMTIMRGSITDKFWMFTFECNVLPI